MALVREATTVVPGYSVGDTKLAPYNITFTANQQVEPEAGWFLLNGAVLSQTTYPTLFARYGSTFNTGGEGAGNFRLPDHTEGKFVIAAGLTNFPTYGASGGEITHALTSSEYPVHLHTNTFAASAAAHGHTASGSTPAASGTHQHSTTYVSTGVSTTGSNLSMAGTTVGPSVGAGGAAHAHTFASGPTVAATTETYNKSGGVSSAGSGTAHNNMMPYVVVGGLLVRYG